MKTFELSLARVVLGTLAVSYLACSAQGQDNGVPGGNTASHVTGGTSSSAGNGNAGSSSKAAGGAPPVTGAAGSPVTQAGSGGNPPAAGGGFNTGVGGAITSLGGRPAAAAGASTGAAGAPATGGCQIKTGTATDLLIDDLEDQNDAIAPLGGRVGYWYTYNDSTVGGAQVPAPGLKFTGTAPGYGPSMFAAVTSGSGFTDYGAGMGFSFNNVGTTQCPYDASAYSGISFWAKSNTGTVALTALVKIPATTPTASGGTCTAKCEDHYALKPAPTLTTTWTQYKIVFADSTTFGQNNFGAVATFDKSKLLALQFQVPKGVQFDISVDDVTFTP